MQGSLGFSTKVLPKALHCSVNGLLLLQYNTEMLHYREKNHHKCEKSCSCPGNSSDRGNFLRHFLHKLAAESVIKG